jgi:hypothetical protein
MRALLLLIITIATLPAYTQEQRAITVRFVNSFRDQPLHPSGEEMVGISGSDISVETLRYYISGVAFYLDDKEVFSEKDSYHLIDAAVGKDAAIIMAPDSIAFNQIRFNLGIDSITNIAGAMGGDLDPTTGMYWTWQSGYINFKLEGTSRNCPTRHNKFQFHLGGYAGADNCLQQVKLTVGNSNTIRVGLPIEKLLEALDLSKQHTIMTPSTEAVALAKQVAALFQILPQ